jgi:hypothetical protein
MNKKHQLIRSILENIYVHIGISKQLLIEVSYSGKESIFKQTCNPPSMIIYLFCSLHFTYSRALKEFSLYLLILTSVVIPNFDSMKQNQTCQDHIFDND